MKGIWGKLVGGVFVVYFLSVFTVFVPYYNWNYIVDPDFKTAV